MRIKRKPELITNAGLIIGGVIVAGLLAVGVISWSLIATSAEQTFVSRLVQAKEDSYNSITQQISQLNEVAKSTDRTKVANFFESFATAVDADVVNVPAQTYFVGLPLVSAAHLKQADDVKTALDGLASALHDTAALLTYEANVADPLIATKSVIANGADEQTKMANVWSNIGQQLESMQPPELVRTVHTTLYNLTASMYQALSALPKATQKHDQRAISAITAATTGYLGQLHSLGPTFKEINQKSDKAVDAALKDAQAVLQ